VDALVVNEEATFADMTFEGRGYENGGW
jgi:hypothetical protein